MPEYFSTAEDSLRDIAPSRDFRDTIDTTRYTSGVIIAASTLDTMTVHTEITDADVEIPIEGLYHPIRTKTAITESGYTVVYLYN